MIHVGFSKGESVDIELLHTIVAAQTRYGKSTTIRTMMQHVPDNFKTVCLDVKDPRDFEGAGVEIPIYIEDKTDPLMLKQLLEQESHLWLRREFPELIDLCKEGDTFEKVYERVNKRMTEKVHPVVKDRLKVLQLLLRKLVENMAKTTLSDKLELPAKNNIMNLSKAPSEIKQLSVYSVVKQVLEKHENVVLVIDELPDFAPQQQGTPSKSIIGEAIRKGGAKGIWLWLSGQTMTGVDKQVLKQAMVWILGHQREINEAQRTLDQIPFKTGLSIGDIMTLPVGRFVVCVDEGAYITYVQPEGVSDEMAKMVSLGQISMNGISESLRIYNAKLKGDDEVYRERCEKLEKDLEEERKRREEVEKEFARQLERLSNEKAEAMVKEANKKVAVAEKHTRELEKRIEPFQRFVEVLRDLIIDDASEAFIEAAKTQLGLNPAMGAAAPNGMPSEVSVSVQPTLTEFTVKAARREVLEASDKDTDGQILLMVSRGFFDQPRKTTHVRAEIERVWNSRPRPGTVETIMGNLTEKGILSREKEKNSWSYSIAAKAKELIHVEAS